MRTLADYDACTVDGMGRERDHAYFDPTVEGYFWSTLPLFKRRLASFAKHSDSRDASLMYALALTTRDYPGRVQDMATLGMSAAESRMCYFGDAE